MGPSCHLTVVVHNLMRSGLLSLCINLTSDHSGTLGLVRVGKSSVWSRQGGELCFPPRPITLLDWIFIASHAKRNKTVCSNNHKFIREFNKFQFNHLISKSILKQMNFLSSSALSCQSNFHNHINSL